MFPTDLSDFHRIGAATEKALVLTIALTLGTKGRLELDDRSCVMMGSSLNHLWVFHMYDAILTFSLHLSSSNMACISSRQSSCIVWKESWGVRTNAELATPLRILMILLNVGRQCGSGSQHSVGEREV